MPAGSSGDVLEMSPLFAGAAGVALCSRLFRQPEATLLGGFLRCDVCCHVSAARSLGATIPDTQYGGVFSKMGCRQMPAARGSQGLLGSNPRPFFFLFQVTFSVAGVLCLGFEPDFGNSGCCGPPCRQCPPQRGCSPGTLPLPTACELQSGELVLSAEDITNGEITLRKTRCAKPCQAERCPGVWDASDGHPGCFGCFLVGALRTSC